LGGESVSYRSPTLPPENIFLVKGTAKQSNSSTVDWLTKTIQLAGAENHSPRRGFLGHQNTHPEW
jgi:hypothetical protein